MISAGDLPHRVTIQRLIPASPDRDAGGAPDSAWGDVMTCWAKVSPLKGREFLAAQEIASEVTGQVQIRYRKDHAIDPKMRVAFGTRYYDILAVVDPLEEHRELVLYVKEGPNDG